MQNCGKGKIEVISNDESILIKVEGIYFEISADGEVKGEIEVIPDTVPGEMDGEGTEESPYVIMSIEDLVFFSKQVNEGTNNYSGKYVELGKTLDFNSDLSYVDPNTTDYDTYLGGDGTKGLKEQLINGLGFRPIGESDTDSKCFRGSLDGKNNAIKNIKIDVETYAGLFGRLNGRVVQNITVNGNIKSTKYAGGIVGLLLNGKTINCINYANITSTAQAGGIIGYCTMNNNTSEVTECTNYGKINSIYAGGIVGWAKGCNTKAVFRDNSNYAYIYGEIHSGGIIGYIENCTIIIHNCLNGSEAIVESNLNSGGAGGICGQGGAIIYNSINLGSISAHKAGGINGSPRDVTLEVRNCYSTGKISGTYVGGIVGRHNWKSTAAEATNCYYLLSATITNGVGDANQIVNAIGVEKLTQEHIEVLNAYVENELNTIENVNCKKWELDTNGNPNFVE